MKKKNSVIRLSKEMGKRLSRHDIFTYSASLSYYTLLSFIPLIFITIAAIGEIVGRKISVTDHTVRWVKDLFPFVTVGIEKNIYGIMEKRGLFGSIGLISLVWSAHMVLAEGEKVIRNIFGVHKKRWLFISHVIAWGIFLLGVIFCAASFLLGLYLRLAADDLLPASMSKAIGPYIDIFMIKYIPAMMVALTVTAAYKLLPQRIVPFSFALTGGVSFALLWEAGKKLFFIYIGKTHFFSLVYGSLGALMMFLLFVYYSALLFIFIAEVLACLLDIKEGSVR